MRNNLFLLLIIAPTLTALTQSTPNSDWLQPVKKRYATVIEKEGDRYLVYRLGYWIDKAGNGYNLISTDTLTKIAVAGNEHWENSYLTLAKTGESTYMLEAPNGNQLGGRKIELKPAVSGPTLQEKVNNGYFWQNFSHLTDSLNKEWPLQHFRWRDGFIYWENFQSKDLPLREFEVVLQPLFQFIWDSVGDINKVYQRQLDYIRDNITSITLQAAVDTIKALPTWWGETYLQKAALLIGNNRPELFFPLADADPARQGYYFYAIQEFDEVKEKLRQLPPDNSPSRREYYKHHKK